MKFVPKSVPTVLKRVSLGLGSAILLIGLLPYLFPGFFTEKINGWTASHLKGKLTFSHATLSFFSHFPNLTLTLYNISLNGSAPFQHDTLLAAREIGLGVDLSSLFNQRIIIDNLFMTDGIINVQVDKQGRANYNVYAASSDSSPTPSSDSATALTIEKIQIERTNIVYNDQSIPMLIRAKGVFYEGKGDLSKAIFDLYTHTHIDFVDLYYDHQPYVLGKRIDADLITQINTNSLALGFARNDLKINKLPVQFNGKFVFLRNGYSMDFNAKCVETDLQNIITALPPELLRWSAKTDIQGFGAFTASLKGQYIAATNTKPDLQLNVKLRNGFVAYEKAPSPVKNLWLDLAVKIPQLNPEELDLTLDSLYFTIDNGFLASRLRLKGLSKPTIHTVIDSDIDLEKWDKAFGLPSFDVKGLYKLHLQADGTFATALKRTSLRKIERVITSIPSFTMTSSLSNGYFKYASLPQPIRDINFTLGAACPDHNYRHAHVALENLRAKALKNVVSGFIKINNTNGLSIDANVQALVHLAEINSFYPLDSLKLTGDMIVQAQAKGQYKPAERQFPVTNATFQLRDGSIQTKYYAHPVERIQVRASVHSRTPSLRTLHVALTPVSFWFEGQPFHLQATLRNFDNLTYAITSRGIVDIGKLYGVVAQPGYDVKGTIKTDLSLRGNQQDAMAGQYDRLSTKGTMLVRELTLSSDLFPLPFQIKTGLFRFAQDKVWFDQFRATYGTSTVDMNGYLTNLVDYLTKRQAPLRGSFMLTSKAIDVDEFMAFAPKSPTAATKKIQPSGVIIVPDNLSVDVKVAVQKVNYTGLVLQNAKGQMVVDSGRIKLQQTGFTLIGTPVMMDATYQSLSPKQAAFNYHIKASDFDIQRAYHEISLFRDLATSAANAEGLISVDYQLQGNLDASMQPIYPSLTGGGVLSVRKVKMNGFRLFGAVSTKTGHNISNPDLADITIKSTIAHNTIIIERTKMRVAGFRPRLEGKVGLDGRLNLTFRLGLPPLGILGIPMTITGTQTKPKVRVGKGTDHDETAQQ
ncbi:AsmA family protein [Spirosoma flavum]|uniref:AsmA-like C-terminal region-containing protein n=1 Tax=Spirosoma flavum TaxID=2048557 RepID=A0ABW6AQ24_9BACT